MGTKRFTAKLVAIKRTILAEQMLTFTVKDGNISIAGGGYGSLEDTLSLAIHVKRMYHELIETLEHQASEEGDLHTLRAYKKAVEDKLNAGD